LAESNTVNVAIYRLTKDFPRRRTVRPDQPDPASAVSVPSNIAEGQGRLSTGEYRQFLGIARGSNFELQTQLEIARALKFGDSKLIDEAEGLVARSWKDDFHALLNEIKELKEQGSGPETNH
jgi:four helix bundle protein